METGIWITAVIVALLLGVIAGFALDAETECPTCPTCQTCQTCETCETCEICEVYQEQGSESLDLVLQHLYDNDGEVVYLIEDLNDDEISQIPLRVNFINDIRDACVAGVKDELYDEIDKESPINNNSIEFDEDLMTRLKINDNDDELSVIVTDWDDFKGTVEVTGTFKQGTDNFKFTLDALFDDGVFDELAKVKVKQLL